MSASMENVKEELNDFEKVREIVQTCFFDPTCIVAE
jgi:hypothetical protein